MAPVKTGLDILSESDGAPLRGQRLGLILHQASVTSELKPALDVFRRLKLNVAALFAPEHGLAGTLQDQVPVNKTLRHSAGIPIFSLYGNQREPAPAMLRYVDTLIFDLQDIGVRYYTFIWTMALAMKAAAKANKPFIVLDRPNPLGGMAVEGNIPDPKFASFVGLYPLPVRHGMTAGELALYLNEKHKLGCDLAVVSMRGWKRTMWFDETGLPWVMPSPNMPTLDAATVYAGMCLLEATNLSEGRGTTRPFELMGAPFVDAEKLARELNRQKLPGATFRPCAFQPTFNKWAGKECRGVQLHVTDRRVFKSFLTGLVFIRTIRKLHPKEFRWKRPPYEYERKKLPMDILCGTDGLRRDIESGLDLKARENNWRSGLKEFLTERNKFLLYRN